MLWHLCWYFVVWTSTVSFKIFFAEFWKIEKWGKVGCVIRTSIFSVSKFTSPAIVSFWWAVFSTRIFSWTRASRAFLWTGSTGTCIRRLRLVICSINSMKPCRISLTTYTFISVILSFEKLCCWIKLDLCLNYITKYCHTTIIFNFIEWPIFVLDTNNIHRCNNVDIQ